MERGLSPSNFSEEGDRSCLFSADDQRYKEGDNMDFIGFFGPKWCGLCGGML